MKPESKVKILPVAHMEQPDGSHEHPTIQALRVENQKLRAENSMLWGALNSLGALESAFQNVRKKVNELADYAKVTPFPDDK
jgi:hypothetical protein